MNCDSCDKIIDHKNICGNCYYSSSLKTFICKECFEITNKCIKKYEEYSKQPRYFDYHLNRYFPWTFLPTLKKES